MMDKEKAAGRKACREAAREALKSILEEHATPRPADGRDQRVAHQAAAVKHD